MHGRGKSPAALASNAIKREGRRCLCVDAMSSFFYFLFLLFFFSQLTLTRHKLGPMCTESGQFTPNQAVLGHIDRQSKRTEMPKKGRNRA